MTSFVSYFKQLSTSWESEDADFVSQIIQAHEHAENIHRSSLRPNHIHCFRSRFQRMHLYWKPVMYCDMPMRGDGVPHHLQAFLGDVHQRMQSSPYLLALVTLGRRPAEWTIYSNGISEDLKQKLRSADSILCVFCLRSIKWSFLIATLVRLTLAVNPDEYLINYANAAAIVAWSLVGLLPSQRRIKRCLLTAEAEFIFCCVQRGQAALDPVNDQYCSAEGAAAMYDAIW